MFKPSWEDFVPEFTSSILSERLKNMPYHLATMLYPPNMVLGLGLDDGGAKFVSFYTEKFDEQRRCLVDVLRAVPILGGNTTRAVGRVKTELLLPEESRKLVYWNGVTWFHGSNGTTPAFLAAYAAAMLGLRAGMKVLTIGFGYGYLSAVFYEAMHHKGQFYGIDTSPKVLRFARRSWNGMGYKVNLKLKDGMLGWGGKVKFDAIWPSLTPRVMPSVWLRELKEGGRIGMFRPYDEDEYDYAAENIENWSRDYPTLQSYQERWWEEVCLSVYRKEGKGLIKVSDLYRLGNVPYVSPIHGITKDRESQSLLGANESKLQEYLNHHVKFTK